MFTDRWMLIINTCVIDKNTSESYENVAMQSMYGFVSLKYKKTFHAHGHYEYTRLITLLVCEIFFLRKMMSSISVWRCS